MKNVKGWLAIDALTICYTPTSIEVLERLANVEILHIVEYDDFTLLRVEGERDCTYRIYYANEQGESKAMGTLSFNMREDRLANEYLVWIRVENETLYNTDFWCISYVAQVLGLVFHNFTTLDIAIDTTRNPLRIIEAFKMLGKKDDRVTTIINGKAIDWSKPLDRLLADTRGANYIHPFITNLLTYRTLSIRPCKAIGDKSKGATLTFYNKANEVEQESGKQYIMEKYGNPMHLWRTEIHLNNEQIKAYIKEREELASNPHGIFTKRHLLGLFYRYINSIIRWRIGRDVIGWEHLFNPSSVILLWSGSRPQ